MPIIKIHYEIGDYEDSLILSGDSVEEIKEKVVSEMQRRGLDADKNNCWSETLEN